MKQKDLITADSRYIQLLNSNLSKGLLLGNRINLFIQEISWWKGAITASERLP